MCEGYHATGEDDHPELDDEFLCEYVDGTMDPSVQRVFEDYLHANPAVAEHVARLRRIRLLLSQYGCQCQAPEGLQARLRRQVTCEMMRAQRPLFPTVTSRVSSLAAFTSAMGVMLVVGMVAGALLFSDAPPPAAYPGLAPAPDVPALFSEAHHGSAIILPQAVSSQYYARFSSFGSVSALRSLWHPDRPPLPGSDTGAIRPQRTRLAP